MVMGPAFMPFLLGINGYVQITRGKNRRNYQRCGTLNSYRPLRYITGEQIFSHIFIKKRKIIVKIFSNFQWVCLFGVYRSAQNFFTHMETSQLPVKGCKFKFLCSALVAIDQWEFFNVPHLLWHGPTLYNGHLRGPVTLTPVAERLAVELSLPVFDDWKLKLLNTCLLNAVMWKKYVMQWKISS